ncbi:UDP-N-acetylmuramate--L-alanine ligase [Nitrosophilus alvini]|uniref:UDP-N-acetylmuramate--L-alanine ligase n=1 Tax=Nitrosophilus alvini TaxID=2714855 RepID=UPI00190E343C|nr:UDP-N-acetylmuramate--L-alanine ligase [Nitrosophilus alvini]
MKIHFIGIGGIGLSGLAQFLKFEGYEVSGSDMFAGSIINTLKKFDIKVDIPHKEENIEDKDIVVYSAAVKPSNIELKAARKRGIKTLCRREALPLVLGGKKVYSVCGAHGKSTTTAILSSIMQDASAIIGAESKEFKSNVRYKNSELVVFEADESDASFLNSNPYCAIVTNAEPEHMEFYKHDLDLFYDTYREFLKKAKIRVINAEDSFLKTLDMEAIRLYPSQDIKNVEFVLIDDEPYTRFVLRDFGEFEVWGFGEHIALDASLAILAAMNELGLDEIKENLKKYRGIKKRFDIIQKESDKIVIDDYAHHPTEIEATLDSLRQFAKLKGFDDIVVIWQPHKYSRTIENLERFIECFKGSSKLVILPVWAAGEERVDIDFQKYFSRYKPLFADRIVKKGSRLVAMKNGKEVDSFENGMIVGFGAGDITYQLRGDL